MKAEQSSNFHVFGKGGKMFCLCNIFRWQVIILSILYTAARLMPKIYPLHSLLETPTSPYGPLGWRLSVSYTLHRCLHGNKMDKVSLSDGQQQLERASGLMHSLRLEFWVQPESCTAEGSKDPERWGGAQSERPQRWELLSGCQTSCLSFVIN